MCRESTRDTYPAGMNPRGGCPAVLLLACEEWEKEEKMDGWEEGREEERKGWNRGIHTFVGGTLPTGRNLKYGTLQGALNWTPGHCSPKAFCCVWRKRRREWRWKETEIEEDGGWVY